MVIRYLFLDLDDTILDFKKSEHEAISQTLAHVGIEPSKTILDLYHDINSSQWKLLEQKKTTREKLKVERYRLFFKALEREDLLPSIEHISAYYLEQLSKECYYLEDSLEVVREISKHCKLYITSNGNKEVQRGRLKDSELCMYMSDIFISDEIGYNKPDPQFFNACFKRIEGFDPTQCMIVGDSISSDIEGGKAAGIKTCYFNLNGTNPPCPQADYTIEHLRELLALVC